MLLTSARCEVVASQSLKDRFSGKERPTRVGRFAFLQARSFFQKLGALTKFRSARAQSNY